jgi:ATP-dependent exoDNAse (exonuclease V) beta subunit
VLRASAGSGKTYALARRFVFFLLSGSVPNNRLNNLLAITFSNNAAREMKERILLFLKQLYLGDREVAADFSRDLALPEPALKARAGEVIEAVLSRYGDFQVKTIDSFMTTVFKASAIDFGYNPDFEILMSNESLMEHAFDLFLRNVREGTEVGRLMDEVVDIIVENATGDAPYPWEATGAILSEIEALYRKVASCGKPVSKADYSAATEEAKRDIRSSIEEMERLITASKLTRNRSSSYGNLLKDAKAGRFADLFERGMKTPPVCKPEGVEEQEAHGLIMEEWEWLRLHIASLTRLFACSYYTPYLRTFEAFSAVLERVKRQEGRIFIEDVNKRLAEYLESDIVPDLYFRLGEAIFHYLIDEFQDTSPIQWRNLLPLIENSLSQGGSLFVVGDTKQAIYGFRDADYRIMKGVETQNPFPSASHLVKDLDINYRSDGAVIAFSEEFFHRMPAEPQAYRKAGKESGLLDYTQVSLKDRKDCGFVETCLLQRDDDEPPEKERVYRLLESLHGRGYRWPDIAILAPRNDDVVKVTTWLNEKGVPFVSYSSLDIRSRKITGEIISLLTFLDSPLDDLSFATFILGDTLRAALGKRGIKIDSQVLHDMCFRNRHGRSPLYKVFREEMGTVWDGYFDRLFRLSGYLPLYDLVVEIYRVFEVFDQHVPEEAALARILEVVKDLEAKGGSTLRRFLQFALLPGGDEADWNIDIPFGIDAVNVMTVHKAKGLEFPVVILLLYGERNKGFRYIVQEDEESVTLLRLKKGMLQADDTLERLYGEEETKVMVARLNSLYVAFTRPRAELYVIGVSKGEKGKGVFPFALFSDTAPSCKGTPPEVSAGGAKEADGFVEGLHHTLSLEAPAPSVEPLRFEEKKRGELVHRILSLIDYADGDIGKRLDETIRAMEAETGAGAVPDNLKSSIAAFLQREPIAGWYERRPGRVVMKEQELADSRGRLFRVDRVIVDPDAVTVIEYKTGRAEADEERHAAQMGNYLSIMGDIYKDRRLEGMIAYVDARVVKSVTGRA